MERRLEESEKMEKAGRGALFRKTYPTETAAQRLGTQPGPFSSGAGAQLVMAMLEMQ